MAILDDSGLTSGGKFQIVRAAGRRTISHVIHDVDGTHSLIRNWPPVMSAVLRYAMTCGLASDFDSPAHLRELVEQVGARSLPGLSGPQPPGLGARTPLLQETDRFCEESAGLSALTQMEYAIRRAIELDNLPGDAGFSLTAQQRRTNSQVCRRIWDGQERFDDLREPAEMTRFIQDRSSRLFRFYEAILNGANRDGNLADALRDPVKWRVPGSLEFISRLFEIGCMNFFVTGAVLYANGGMLEEIEALGYPVGPGRMIQAVLGSQWDRKIPKGELFEQVLAAEAVSPSQVLVIGDGRSEIQAAAAMGCVAISRLPASARRQRELHRGLGANYIIEDYTDPAIKGLIRQE